jgi:RNA polymerase sigma-B factor
MALATWPAGTGDDPDADSVLVLEALLIHWGKLTELDRKLLLLRFYGEMTEAEIAAQLGVSEQRTSRLLQRTLNDLHELASPGRIPRPRQQADG